MNEAWVKRFERNREKSAGTGLECTGEDPGGNVGESIEFT